ncbi:ABC transporter ATP-binding protein [bacterium]|nr:MAG: ABC transporter ATP-binding protein [bacterium]
MKRRSGVRLTAMGCTGMAMSFLRSREATLMACVVAEGLTKSYPETVSLTAWLRARGRPQRRAALRGVSFTVREGEIFGILGANGAGKTTILKILSTLVVPDGGRMSVAGHDVAREPALVRGAIGLCPAEERSFYTRLSGRENLRFFGRLQGLGGAALESRIESSAVRLGIADRLDGLVQGYSTGMRQRLNLARALLPAPRVLVLDEPTKALDPLSALRLRRFVREELVARDGHTVIIATNQLDEAWSLCDRLLVLSAGCAVAEGTCRELEALTPEAKRAGALESFLHLVGEA